MDKTKQDLMSYSECEDCDEMKEYVGNKLTRLEDRELKFTQDVLVQSSRTSMILVTRNGAPPQRLAQF